MLRCCGFSLSLWTGCAGQAVVQLVLRNAKRQRTWQWISERAEPNSTTLRRLVTNPVPGPLR